MDKSDSTKQVLLSVLGVLVLVVSVIGVSFAFFTYSKQGSTMNTLTTGTFLFKYNEPGSGIQLSNAMPISDSEGVTQSTNGSVFDFTVTSTVKGEMNIGYEISATETTNPLEDTTLDAKYIKVRLTSSTDGVNYDTEVLPPTYFSQLNASSKIAGVDFDTKKLYDGTVSGTIAGSTVTHYYRLQLWFSEYDENGNPTEMVDDICTADGNPVSLENPQVECSSDTPNVAVKGTNNKAFSVKVNVTGNQVES